jgi:hypothetical protein
MYKKQLAAPPPPQHRKFKVIQRHTHTFFLDLFNDHLETLD